MKFHLKFAMDNAAFADDPCDEVVRILQVVREQVLTHSAARSDWQYILRDSNGNRVGEWRIEGEA